jgi:von Willebrand factor type A domain/Aerotolerance regulator N-terminal
MSFANPAALLWAALAIPIVIFYILKLRLRRVPVSTVIFWRQIFEEKKPRSLWQRLRHLLSLAVQILLLLLLVGALVEPFFSWESKDARRIVLAIDNSASMNATDAAPSRLGQAKEAARRVIAGLRFRDEMAIVVAGTQPQVVCGLTGHQRTLREALDAIPPTDGPTKLTDAVALARRLIADQAEDRKRGQVIVCSDACAEGADKLAVAEDVRLLTVGSRTGNVGITQFQVRRSLLDPVGYEILVEIVNFSDESVKCRFELDLNGNIVDVVPLDLAAFDSNAKEKKHVWSQVIEKTSAEGGRLTGKINHADALSADNVAVALLPKREFQNVLLVSEAGNLFLEKVLEANPLVKLTVAKKPPEPIPAGSVCVFHKAAPEKLPPGPVLVIDPANDCDLWKIGDKLQNPIVTQQDKDSPLMANVRLDNVLMPEARKLTFAAGVKPQVLAAALTGDPVFVALDRPSGPVLVLSVNLDLGDLPLRTAFPILASNALAHFAGGKGELHEALATGATTEIALPATGEFLLRSPDGSTRKLPSGVAKTTIGPFDRAGIWSVVGAEPNAAPIREIACNLASAAESDLRPPSDLPAPAVAEFGVASGLLGRPIWFYLIFLAWALAALEWFLYQRRWIS